MTPEQIRKIVDTYTGSLEKLNNRNDPPTVTLVDGITNGTLLVALVEIAAQLAELNERLRQGEVDTVLILKYVGDQMRGLNLAYEDFKKTLTSNGAIDVNTREI